MISDRAWRSILFSVWIIAIVVAAFFALVRYARASDDSVFIIVLQFSAFGYSATIVPDDPKFHVAYASKVDCDKQINAVRREMRIPSVATLNRVVCRKLELKK